MGWCCSMAWQGVGSISKGDCRCRCKKCSVQESYTLWYPILANFFFTPSLPPLIIVTITPPVVLRFSATAYSSRIHMNPMERQNIGPWPYNRWGSIGELNTSSEAPAVVKTPKSVRMTSDLLDFALPMPSPAEDASTLSFFGVQVLLLDDDLLHGSDSCHVSREFATPLAKVGTEYVVQENEKFVVRLQNRSATESCRVVIKRSFLNAKGSCIEGKKALANQIVLLAPLESRLLDTEDFKTNVDDDPSFSLGSASMAERAHAIRFEFLVRHRPKESAVRPTDVEEGSSILGSICRGISSLRFMCSIGFPPIESFIGASSVGNAPAETPTSTSTGDDTRKLTIVVRRGMTSSHEVVPLGNPLLKATPKRDDDEKSMDQEQPDKRVEHPQIPLLRTWDIRSSRAIEHHVLEDAFKARKRQEQGWRASFAPLPTTTGTFWDKNPTSEWSDEQYKKDDEFNSGILRDAELPM